MDPSIEHGVLAHAHRPRHPSTGSRVARRHILLGTGGMAAGLALGGLSRMWQPATVANATAPSDDNAAVDVLRFYTMAPVTGQFVGPSGTPIRGLHGGGLPWALRAADGELSTDGRLRVRVQGLVLAAGPLSGTNPSATFRAIVSFATAAPIYTAPVPASTSGDADMYTYVELPHPGFAPIIFVGPGTNAVWFAVTGLM